MANSEKIAIKYTDEIYAARSELSRLMGTSMTDFAWVQIQEYRKQNSRYLSLRSLQKFNFSYTESPLIRQKIEDFEAKLLHLADLADSLDALPELKKDIYMSHKATCLRAIADIEMIMVNDTSIRAMLNETYMENNQKHAPILGYRDALANLEAHPNSPLSEDLLGEIYEAINNQNELTVFYRTKNLASASLSQVDRVYEWAPFDRIENAMEDLFAFIQNDAGYFSEKAAAAFFYIYYIKPFGDHNEAVTSLLFKHILSANKIGKLVSLLPIENLLSKTNQKFQKLFYEAQRQNDLTYILLHIISYLNPIIESLILEIKQGHAKAINEERSQIDISDKPAKPIEKKSEPEVPVEVETPKTEATISEIKVEKAETIPLMPQTEVILSVTPSPRMSEKESKEYAKYIRESNPLINKAQANFYSTHCTQGRYYSIADYKKATKCAYETARTSMDNLAAQGLYKKMQIKNKYVYTPVRQGDLKS